MPESVKEVERGVVRPVAVTDTLEQHGCMTVSPDCDASTWRQRLTAIFGAHDLDDRAGPTALRRIEEGQCGVIRYWRVAHDAQRLVVSRRGEYARLNLKTDTFLLLVVEHGDVEIGLFSGSTLMTHGDGLFLSALEPLVYSTSGSFSGTWVEMPVWWLIELFEGRLTGAREKLDGRLGSTILLRAALSILCERRGPDQADDLVSLFGDVLRRSMMISGRDQQPHEGQFDRISRFVGSHYRQEGLSPKDAAQALGCSLSSLHKCCASAGTTFGALVASMRLSVAAYRLTRDSESISQIAFDCGFASFSHFCHSFKARYGVTARSLRNRHAPISDANAVSGAAMR